jgi:drug/metabolite transporter (DMT)-like permease
MPKYLTLILRITRAGGIMLTNWFPLVLIYIMTNSTSKILQKFIIRNEKIDDIAFCIAFMFGSGLLTLPLIVFEPVRLPTEPKAWIAFIVSCIGYTYYMSVYFYCMKRLEISQVETIGTSRSIWMMVIGIIAFGEVITLSKVIGICLIIAAIILVYARKGALIGLEKNHLLVLSYAIVISICYALDKYALGYFSLVLFQVLIFTIPAIIIAIIFPASAKKIIPMFKTKRNTVLMLICFFVQAVSVLALYRAYQIGGQLSIVGPIAQTTTVVTITAGILILREYWNIKRKIIGILLALLGVIFLRFLSF